MTMRSESRFANRAPLLARARSVQGVTLVEATIVLLVSAILIGVAAPVTSRSLDSARLTRATEDAKAIRTAVHNLVTDCCAGGFDPFTATGLAGGATIHLAVSDGDIPYLGEAADLRWDDIVNPAAAVPVDFLERHLVTNTPGGTGAYVTGSPGWRGAYIGGPIDPDPWGNRYAVNTLYLKSTTANDVFVISAGPDEIIDSAFAMNGAYPEGDDVMAVVRRDLGLVVP